MGSSSAHIQMTGSGYDGKRNQQARNKRLSNPRPISEFSSNKLNTSSSFKNNAIMNNTNLSLNNTSKSMMDKNLKINNFF
jgi:hypothetical protein